MWSADHLGHGVWLQRTDTFHCLGHFQTGRVASGLFAGLSVVEPLFRKRSPCTDPEGLNELWGIRSRSHWYRVALTQICLRQPNPHRPQCTRVETDGMSSLQSKSRKWDGMSGILGRVFNFTSARQLISMLLMKLNCSILRNWIYDSIYWE